MKLLEIKRKELQFNGVYCIINIVNNKKYVGSCAAKDFIYMRLMHHKKDLENKKHCNIKLQRAFNKYGIENFIFEILEICVPENCIKREQYYIDLLKPEYNIAKIAGNTLGRICSEETRQKIRKKALERYEKNSELREFMSKIQTGLKRSEESIALRVKKQLGRKHSEKTKQKMSDSRKDFFKSEKGIKQKQDASKRMSNRIITDEVKENMKKANRENKGKKVIFNDVDIYNSVIEASEILKINKHALYDVLRGRSNKYNIKYI